jgi:hypothetical protein
MRLDTEATPIKSSNKHKKLFFSPEPDKFSSANTYLTSVESPCRASFKSLNKPKGDFI